MNTNTIIQTPKIRTDTVWAIIGKFGTGFAQLAVGIVLAKSLTVEDFGYFQVVLRIIGFAAIVGSLGLAWTVVRLVAEGIQKGSYSYSYFCIKKIIRITVICGLAAGLIIYFLGSQYCGANEVAICNGVIVSLCVLAIVAALQQVIPEAIRGMGDVKYASLFSGFAVNSLFLISLLGIYYFYSELQLVIAVQLYLLVSVLTVATSALLLFQKFKYISIRKDEDTERYTTIVRITFPLFLSSCLSFIILQADVWLVARYVSIEQAGIYGAVSRLVMLLSLPLMIATSVIKPRVTAKLLGDSREDLQKFVTTTANITFACSIVPAAIFLLFGGVLLEFLFGPSFRTGADVLSVLVVGQLVVLTCGPCGVVAVMAGRQDRLLKSTAAGCLVFIVASVILGNMIGAVGVAAGVVLGTITIQLLTVADIRRVVGISTSVLGIWRAN